MEIGVKQAAELLNVSDKTVYRWLAASQIPFYRVGSQYRFSKNELLQWVEAKPNAIAPAETATDPGPVSLVDSLRAGGIFYRIEGKNVRGMLAELLSLMRLPTDVDASRILEQLYEREQLATTAVGEGIAFPHCRDIVLPNLSNSIIALGFLETPVDFFAIDKKPVSTVFLFLSPSAQSSIRIMSRLAYAIRQPAFASLLQDVATRESLFTALAEIDQELKQP